jgi:hypothetical protein
VLKAGDFPTLLQVGESGEIKLGHFTEASDTYALATYGRRLAFSRQSIINDDLNAFARVMAGYAVRLADFENALWFTLLQSGGSNHGPTLGDTGQLFNATAVTTPGGHANLTGTGTAISVASLGVGRATMRKQVSLEGQSQLPGAAPIKLNLSPRYLLVGPDIEVTALQFSTQIVPAQGSNVNPYAGRHEVVVDANISSATAWYLFADPARAAVSVYGSLQGSPGPRVESRQGFEIEGVEMKVAMDFGVAFVDFRGAYKNVGA